MAQTQQADEAADGDGDAEIEEDDQLLHLRGGELGEDDTQGGHETGAEDQAVTCDITVRQSGSQ